MTGRSGPGERREMGGEMREFGGQSEMERWQGRNALVTGASSGIGRALVRRLVRDGLRVLGLARRADKLKELEDSLREASGQVKCLQCDLTNESSVQMAFDWLEENWGQLDILVNNAGVFQLSPATEADFHTKLKEMMSVNLLALSHCTTLAIQSMKRHSVVDGHIVNINSVAGRRLVEKNGYIPYTASKHALSVVSTQLLGELARQQPGIRVTDIKPGLTRSEMSDQVETLFGRPKYILEAEDVVEAIVFCLAAPPHVNVSEVVIQPIVAPIMSQNGVHS